MCDQYNGRVTKRKRVGPVGCVCDQEDGCVTSRISVCDQENGCVSRRMSVRPVGWMCDHMGWVCIQ